LKWFKILLLVIIPGLFFSCGEKLPGNISSILKQKCDSCHSYKIYKKVTDNNKKNWESILHKIVIKGAYLKESEFNALLNYFGKTNLKK
jgi:hypothetical protein